MTRMKQRMAARVAAGVVTTSLLLGGGFAWAGQLVYEPINPSFGGNPLNGSYLFNKAQSQDDNEDPDAPDFGSLTETDLFLQDLRAGVVNDAINDAKEGEAGRTSVIESSTLRVRIRSLGNGGFVMHIVDRRTGEETTVNFGQPSGQF
ncbi:curli assembly protein CsgF [Halomonas icarae]|nr:curli assembly protein CsgF [Halomonas icarae]MDR5903044.1 curli assembly protein CsgF [Halomonas icarae]